MHPPLTPASRGSIGLAGSGRGDCGWERGLDGAPVEGPERKVAPRFALERAHPPTDGCAFDITSPGYDVLYSRHGTFADNYGRAISFFVHM